MKRNRRGGRADRLNNNNKQQRHELWSRKCNSVWRRGSSWSVHSVHSWSCSWLQQHLALRGSSVLNERARIVLFLLSYRMAVHPCTPPLSTQTTHSPAGERSVTTEWPLYQTELGQRRPDLTGEFTHSLQLPDWNNERQTAIEMCFRNYGSGASLHENTLLRASWEL